MHWDSLTFCSSDPNCKGSRVSPVVLLERELKAHRELSDLKNRFRSHWAQKPRQKVKNSPIPDLDIGPLSSSRQGRGWLILKPSVQLASNIQEGLKKIYQCQNTFKIHSIPALLTRSLFSRCKCYEQLISVSVPGHKAGAARFSVRAADLQQQTSPASFTASLSSDQTVTARGCTLSPQHTTWVRWSMGML